MTDEDRFWVGPASAPDTYQLVNCLGGGAEGEVWTAVLPLSAEGRRDVAVKILPNTPGSDDEESWINHGHLLRSIAHPGVVRVIEVFAGPVKHRTGTVPDGIARYLIMDLVEGINLREWLDDHPGATASERLRPLNTVAAALDEMHSGAQTKVPVAHGDVKPSNIIIRADSSTVLVDLGLTRLTDGAGRVGKSRPYAAPELFESDSRSTPEADRFAFAATVVHALLGEAPPAAPNGGPDLDQIAARLRASPLTARRPILVNRLLETLSAAPAARPAALRVWLSSLTETLSQVTGSLDGSSAATLPEETMVGGYAMPVPPPTAAPAPSRPRRRKTAVIVASAVVALVVLLGGGVAYAMTHHGSSNPSAQGRQTTGPLTTPTTVASAAPSTEPPASASAEPSIGPSGEVSPAPSGEASEAPSETPSEAPSTTPGPAEGTPLAGNDEQDFITGTTGNPDTDAGNLNINGQVSVTGFESDECCNRDYTYAESISIDLGRDYNTFLARLGVDDDSDSGVYSEIKIYGDGRLLYDHKFKLGQSKPVSLDVTGVLRLEIDFKGRLYAAPAAVGDPVVK